MCIINTNKTISKREGNITYTIQPRGNKILLIVLDLTQHESLTYEHICKYMIHNDQYDIADSVEVIKKLEQYIELLR